MLQPDVNQIPFVGAGTCAAELSFNQSGFILVMDGDICREARIAMSAVAVVPKRAPEAEAMLNGKKLTPELIEQAAEHASLHECSPISDIRASAEYRRELVRLSVRDGLMLALDKKEAEK